MFSALIYYKDRSTFVCLPDVQTGERQILLSAMETGWDEDCLIHFFAIDGLWRVACPVGMAWKSSEPLPANRAISDGFNMSAAGEGRLFGLYCRKLRREDTAMKKYMTGEFLSIGKSQSDILLEDKFVSERHCVITRNAEGYEFKDISKNGSFVNGRRILGQSIPLRTGDVVSLACGFRLAFFGEYFAVNAGGALKAVQKEPVTPRIHYDPTIAAPAYVRIARPPHFYPALEPVSYQVEPAPAPEEGDKQLLLISIGPSLTMSLPMLMGSFLAGTSSYAKAGVIMMATSSALAVGWTLVNHIYRKRQAQRAFLERMDDYIERLGNFEEEAERRMDDMVAALLKMHPSAQECCDFALQRSTHLWQNIPGATAFLTLRLGLGMLRLPCEIVAPKLKMGERPQGIANAPYEAAERLNKLYRGPVCIPMEEKIPVGIIYTQRTIEHVQSLLLQLVCLNSYMDCRLAILGEEGSDARWRGMRFLPHVAFENDSSQHMIATTTEAKRSLLRDLSDLLQYRAGRTQAGGEKAAVPRYIVVCEDSDLWADNPFFRIAMQEGLGFCMAVLARTHEALPKECSRIIDLSDAEEGVIYDRVQGTQTRFKPEQVQSEQLWAAFAALVPLRDNEQVNSSAIPGKVDFLESFGIRTARELEIRRSWNTQSTSRSIEANIGFKAGARPFLLDISDKAHGPHGLVAGTTGSGKSVLLQTIVLSLAVKYSPTELQFILIDYKGGGAFACFRDLPHVVGLVDNLNGRRTILRALASVNGEILRRQAIFKRLGVSDINDYIKISLSICFWMRSTPTLRVFRTRLPLANCARATDERHRGRERALMKKLLVGLIIAFFIIAALPSALAEDSVSIDFIYGDMEELFAQALAPDTLPGDVRADFESIVSLYEANPGVQDFEYATYYYCYASGYLAFLREDWAAAKTSFDKCRIYNMGEEEAYYNFAMGMLYAQNEDYARAIPMFDAAASSGGALSSRALNKSMEYTCLYQDNLRDAGNAALADGDYQTALAYFDTLRTEFPESDGAALYDECLAQSGAAQVRDELDVRVLSDTQAEISWTSTREKCRIFVSMALDTRPAFDGVWREIAEGETLFFDASSAVNVWSVEGDQTPRTVVLADLLPGTAYGLWMEDAQNGELLRTGFFVTEDAPPHATLHVDRSVLYAYQQIAYEMTRSALKEEASFWVTMSDVLQAQTGYDIVLSPSATGDIGYALIFRTVDAGGSVLPREALAWQEMTMLLHLDGIATLCYEETFDAENSVLETCNAELTVLRIDDLCEVPLENTK